MSAPFHTCYRHPDQTAGVICQRCDRPICPQCMRQAAVGFHCPECARGGRQQVYTTRTLQRVQQPVAALTLIAINVAVFIIGNGISGGQTRMRLEGGLIAPGGAAQIGGSVITVRGVGHGEWWRVVTSGFLHESLWHLAANMISLWILGQLCERLVGRWRFVLVYFVALLAGSFGAMLISPDSLTVGASGAIFGLFGLLLVAARAKGVNLAETGLLTWLGINLVFTFWVPGISIGGHIGGLLGGGLAALAVIELPKRVTGVSLKSRDVAGAALAVALGAACFVATLAVAAGHVAA